MKITDLMIGNWVDIGTKKLVGGLIKPVFCKIVTLNEIENIVVVKEENNYRFAKCEDVEPVDLTEEILENNFPKAEDGGLAWWPFLDTPVTKSFTIECPYEESHYTTKIVKYVHEIQNILKIHGIEKEIELL